MHYFVFACTKIISGCSVRVWLYLLQDPVVVYQIRFLSVCDVLTGPYSMVSYHFPKKHAMNTGEASHSECNQSKVFPVDE